MPFRRILVSLLVGGVIYSMVHPELAFSQSFPSGFSQVMVANGISNPTVMAFAPDGRIFVAQQNGVLRVVKNGALLQKPFISISVNSSGERGLLGIAFDPAFISNKYVYLYYTLSSGANNRISRFTASGDTALAGSEVVLLNLDPLSTATNHNGGNLQFGADGKLYVGIGENANTAYAQNLDTYHGKILRINPDGSVPAGNPYTSGSEQRKRVWTYGLRNPYTLAFSPRSNRLFVNDVGQNTWEEINNPTVGGQNFGWPTAEGNSSNPSFVNPVYAYGHGTTNGKGCAITGGTFFEPTQSNYPSSYFGKYFYFDYCGLWIDLLSFNGSNVTRSSFGTGLAGNPVCLMTGTDGALYYLSRTNGALYKITYSTASAPVIVMQPQSDTVPAGGTAVFSVSVSGTSPLTYEWYKNGNLIAGAQEATLNIPNVQPQDTGNYSVKITNQYGTAFSDPAYLQVTKPNTRPKAYILSPAVNATYGGGDVIAFNGYGTDTEDGIIDSSNFRWIVEFFHDTHTHPGPSAPDSVASGIFVIPVSGETSTNVFYRLYLIVKDSGGQEDTAFTDLLPRTSLISLKTLPTGLTVLIDGQPCVSPCNFSSVEGVIRNIDVTSPQTLNGITYGFSNWSNGGNKNQNLYTPVSDTTLTASFTEYQSVPVSCTADAYVRSGSTSGTNYGASTLLYTRNNSITKGICISYLRFDITSIKDPVAVKLRLYGKFDKSGNSSVVDVFDVASQTWQEQTITYNNKPVEGTISLASVSANSNTAKFYEWDLTQYIIDKKSAGSTVISLSVKNRSTTAGFLQFNSKENAAFRPELVSTQKSVSLTALSDRSVEMHSIPANTEKWIRLSPNPASGFLQIESSGDLSNSRFLIVDITGRIMMKGKIEGMKENKINVSALPNGLYLLNVQNNGINLTQKFRIQNK